MKMQGIKQAVAVVAVVAVLLTAAVNAATYECPIGLPPIQGNLHVETCAQPSQTGSCPAGSTGLWLTITGNGNVPKFSWGLLQSSDSYSVMFQQFFEMSVTGQRIPASTQSLPSWTWTFCTPMATSDADTNGSTIVLDFFGTKSGQGVYISAHIDNSSSTTDFKWSMNIDDYVLHGSNNLVLFSKYQNKDGKSQLSLNSHGQIVNGNSYITTARNASFDSTIDVPVNIDIKGDQGPGFYVVFDLVSAGVQPSDPFHLFLDPEFGMSGGVSLASSLSAVLFALLCACLLA